MDTNTSILQSAKHFFFGTLFSRVTGLARDMAMAFWFGSAPELAAFMVAYRLANLFRRLFGEGNLQAGFVPHFEALRVETPKKSFLFYRDTAFSLFLSLAIFIGFVEILLLVLSRMLNPVWAEIAQLSMWMAPGLLFICLSSLNSAFLRCQRKYFLTAASPAFFNFIWILAAFVAHFFHLRQAVIVLSCGVTLAFIVQWTSTARAAKKEWGLEISKQEWFRPDFFSSDWKMLVKPMAVGIIGAGALQLNSALDAIFGLMADSAGPVYLWYAIRIQQLPLALFGIALSGALLPPLSRAMQEKALDRYQNLLETALERSTLLLVPCSFALFTLGGVGLNLLFGRGDFTSLDVQQTLFCLWAYGLSIVPSVFVLLFSTGFYAQKSYSIPTLASLASVILNTLLNSILVFGLGWGVVSIALATSLSALLNGLILYFFLSHKLPLTFWLFFIRLMLISAAASVIALFFSHLVFHDVTWEIFLGFSIEMTRSFSEQLVQFLGLSAFFAGSFFVLAKLSGLGRIFRLLEEK
jgi:putative peptidoglycan lipid II flippase